MNMAVALFCIFVLLCLWLLREMNFSKSQTIFAGSFLLYYGMAFLQYFFVNNAIRYTEAQVVNELALLVSFAAGLCVPQLLTRSGADTVRPLDSPPGLVSVRLGSSLLIVTGLGMYVAFVMLAYGGFLEMAHADRYTLYLKKQGLGSLAVGFQVCLAGILVRIGYYLLYRKTVAQRFPVWEAVLAVVLMIAEFATGERSGMLFFLLPLVVMLLTAFPRLNMHMLYVVPLCVLLMQLPANLRRAPNTKLVYFNEFMAPARVDAHVYAHLTEQPLRYGGTYGDVVINMAPAWLRTARPDLPPAWYAKTFFPIEYKQGGGYGFSVVAEAMINFGVAGPFLYGVLLSLLLLWMDRRRNRSGFFVLAGYCLLQYFVFNITRSGLAALVKPAIAMVVIPIALVYLLDRFMRHRRIKTNQVV